MIGINGQNIMLNKPSDILKIVLFDSSCNLKELEQDIEDKSYLVITFDYESHQLLNKNNIKHEISDSYLNRIELETIQKKSYELVDWFKEEKPNELEYKGVNVGSLMRVEFNYFLVPFLKNFVAIIKIYQKYSSAEFSASIPLHEIVKTLTNNVKKLNENSATKEEFYYDSVSIPLKIKNHSFSFKLSKNRFLKLKNISEKSIHRLFGPKKLHTNKKSILLVEFDPVRYRHFLSAAKNASSIMLYNRRRPTIWNSNSYNSIKKSNCKIVTLYDLMNKNLEINIKNAETSVANKISSALANADFLEGYFSIYSHSFWEIIEKKFKNLLKKRFLDSIKEIEIASELLEKYQFSSIAVWSEIGSTEQIIIKLAKKHAIPVVLFQHGLFFDDELEGTNQMNKFHGVFPIDSDEIIVWGAIEKNHQLKNGIREEKIQVLGNPYYDRIQNISNPKNKHILLATSGPVIENSIDLTIETIEKNQSTIKKICEVVTNLQKNLVIKLHPSPDEFDPTSLARKINHGIKVHKTGEILKLIEDCDVFVVIDISTVILDAQLLGKPVICVQVKDSGYGTPSVLTSNSCLIADKDNFQEILMRVLTDSKYKQEAVERGYNYAKSYLVNVGCTSEKILEHLNKKYN